MITKTTETAIMALLFVHMRGEQRPISPRQVAGRLAVSSSYLAKIFTRLVKAGILQAHRGVQGGVTLRRPATAITLLDIVNACQGPLVAGAADEARNTQCNFHQAVSGFERSVIDSLSGWTLERLSTDPCPAGEDEQHVACRVADICPKRQRTLRRREAHEDG